MSVFLVIFFLSTLAFISPSEATHEKKLPSAVVVGTVYCDTCFQEDFSKTSHFISGATVAVECKDGSASRPSFRKEVKTDEHGEFKVHLPFSLSKHVKKIEGCSVTLISSSEPYCAVASTATSSSLHLKSRKQGTHIFSAGFFTFKPLKQPDLCNQKPSIQNSKEAVSLPPIAGLAIPPPIQDPAVPDLPPPTNHFFLPPLPRLPELPPLPQLPPLPGLVPLPPIPGKTTNSKPAEPLKDKKEAHPDLFFPPLLPPNPLLPPPLIPNPLQPPPLIPLPKVPELPPLPQLPPLPGLVPLPPIPGKTTNSKPAEPLKEKKEAHPDLFFPPLLPPNPLLPPPLIPNPLQPPPLIPLPKVPELPPLPQLPPLPGLIPLPPIPGKTTNSKPAESLKEKKEAHPDLFFPPLLPPNPLLPPPLIPNPLQPPPLIPLPKVPELPPLPQLPPLPGQIPLPPIPGKTTNSKPAEPLKDKKEAHPDFFFPPLLPPNPLLPPPLIPNPLQPPPLIPNPFQPPPLIPNPFQPPPLIPNPFQPPPAPLIPFPKIPGLTPSPSPPPPLLPFPFPPIFPSPPPFPRIPGIPPASSSKQTSP